MWTSSVCAEPGALLLSRLYRPSMVERLREWFGTPVAAGKTVVWICWASFLVSVALGVLVALYVAIHAAVT